MKRLELEGGVSPLEVSPSVAESSLDEFPIFSDLEMRAREREARQSQKKTDHSLALVGVVVFHFSFLQSFKIQ